MMNKAEKFDINKAMQSVANGQVTYDELTVALSDVASLETKGEASSILKIIKSGAEMVAGLVNLADKHTSVPVEENKVSILTDRNENVNNYSSGTLHKIPGLGVKYMTLSKYKFSMVVNHNSKHNSLGGTYIKDFGFIVDDYHCGPANLIVNVTYSSPVNLGSNNEAPNAKMTYSMAINYGDCCLMQGWYTLNGSVYGDKGIVIDTITNHEPA